MDYACGASARPDIELGSIGWDIRRVVHLSMGKMSYFPLPASEHQNDADEEDDQGYAEQDDFHKGHDRQGAPPLSGPLEQNRPTERIASQGAGTP